VYNLEIVFYPKIDVFGSKNTFWSYVIWNNFLKNLEDNSGYGNTFGYYSPRM